MSTMYNAGLFALANRVRYDERLVDPLGSAAKRSTTCGSSVIVDINLDVVGRVCEIGLLVRCCLLGRASASLFANAVMGRTPDELVEARDELAAWLSTSSGRVPDWPDIEALAPALPFAARHASIRLVFEAGAAAARNAAKRQCNSSSGTPS